MKINRIKWIVCLLENMFRKKAKFNSGCSSRWEGQASSTLSEEEVSRHALSSYCRGRTLDLL